MCLLNIRLIPIPFVVHVHIINLAGMHVNIIDHINISMRVHIDIRNLIICAQHCSYDLYYAYYYESCCYSQYSPVHVANVAADIYNSL